MVKRGDSWKMDISVLTVGPIQTNCYVVHQEGNSQCVVIDPGEEAAKIADFLKRKGLECKGILLTHGHFDHITGVAELAAATRAKTYAYEDEKDLMMDPALNGSSLMGYEVALEPEVLLKDRQNLEIAGMRFQVIHTPGHTQGGVCYYIEEEKALFSGDTLFCQSVGRTDFPTGKSSTLIHSIQDKLMPLPDDTMVYTGHEDMTTIGMERKYNPFL